MSRTRWYGRLVGGLVLVVMLGVGLQSAAAQRASLSGIDAKLDQALQQLDTLQGAVDALFQPSGTIFPGDGVGGPNLRYQDNGDGTVTDLNTGLMWEMKVAGGGTCTGALHAVDATCVWLEAIEDWIGAINAEGGTGFAGHNDWRLANIRELMSIVDFSRSSPSPLIAPVFGPTAFGAAGFYWSSTTHVGFPIAAWVVIFDPTSGPPVRFDTVGKSNTLHVRAVRGGR